VSVTFGILSTCTIDITLELESLFPMSYAFDFAYIDALDIISCSAPQEKLLKSNMHLATFLTIDTSDIFWEGIIQLDRTQYRHGIQRGVEEQMWLNMFNVGLPCALTRQGKLRTFGALKPFRETGIEGVIWTIYEYGKIGYEGLHCLEDGDLITVYSRVSSGESDWSGELQFSPPSPAAVELKKSRGYSECTIRQAYHTSSQEWLALSHQKRPCIITTK